MFERTKVILRKFDKATHDTLESEFEIEVIKKNNYTLCEFLERLEDKCEIWETLRSEYIKDIKALEHDIKTLYII